MNGIYTTSNAGDLLGELLLRREKRLYGTRCRENLSLFIDLLSHYLTRHRAGYAAPSGRLYEHISKKYGRKPCGGYSVRIAIKRLPGNFKNISKKQNL